MPPSGVKLSCMAMTAPSEVAVVVTANSDDMRGAEPDLLALHVAHRGIDAGRGQQRVAAGLGRVAAARRRRPSGSPWSRTARSPAACRRTMTPNVTASANGMTISDQVSTTLVSAVGFSNGCAELALKKPPPLVPSSLIASWNATGPSAMVCLAPSSVLRVHVAGQRLRHAGGDQEHRVDDDDRQQHVERDPGQIDPEIAERPSGRRRRRRAPPSPRPRCRSRPRGSCGPSGPTSGCRRTAWSRRHRPASWCW